MFSRYLNTGLSDLCVVYVSVRTEASFCNSFYWRWVSQSVDDNALMRRVVRRKIVRSAQLTAGSDFCMRTLKCG